MTNPAWWQALVETALLGTERRSFEPGILPPELQSIQPQVSAEQAVLQTAALAATYLRAGREPQTVPLPDLPVCPPEALPYAPQPAMRSLRKLLDEVTPNRRLLGFWLNRCAERGWVVEPGILPALFGLMAKPHYADGQPALRIAMGERGQWLSRFNTDWAYSKDPDWEMNWQEGNGTDRLVAFRQLRQTDPAKALALLQASWPTEAAKDRVKWMGILAEQAMPTDESFANEVLAELATVKKPTATHRDLRTHTVALLLDLPNSALFRETQESLTRYMTLKREMLINRVKVLVLPAQFDGFFDEKNMAAYGLDTDVALTDDKQITQWFYQLLAIMHPSCWATVFAVTIEQLLPQLSRQGWFVGEGIMQFTKTVIRHRIEPLARELLGSVSVYQRARLLSMLPQRTREDRLMGADEFFKNIEEYSYLTGVGATGWSIEFSQWVVQELARNLQQQYQLYPAQRQFIADMVLVLHPSTKFTQLEKAAASQASYPAYGSTALKNQLIDPLTHWLHLRQQLADL